VFSDVVRGDLRSEDVAYTVRPHPSSSARSKQPSTTQPRWLSRYGHLKDEVIY
jgi:hypothetical protein